MKTTISLAVATLVSAGTAWAQAPAPADAALAPRIVCAEPVFDFGEKSNSEFVEHDYPIRNEGTLSLEIRGVQASCGCTAVKPSQDVIPPGGEAVIHARLDLRGRSGLQAKTITVQSNDPQTPSLILQLRGTAVQALRAEPSTLFFGRVGPDGVRSRTFEVVSAQGPIQIQNFRSDNPGIEVTQVPAEAGAEGTRHRFEVKLAEGLPEGTVNGSIVVQTDLAGQPALTIAVAAYLAPAAAPAPEPAP